MNVTIEIIASVFLRVLAVLLLVMTVLPAQYRETKIKDDLNKLRTLIFWGLVTYATSTVFLMLVRVNFLFTQIHGRLESVAYLVSSLGDFMTTVILYLIYNSKYYYNAKDKK